MSRGHTIAPAFLIALLLLSLPLQGCSKAVTFPSEAHTGEPLTIPGRLTKPRGDGPFPAVVLLPGCDGMRRQPGRWVEKLVAWGYVTLEVDTLRPRGHDNVCGGPRIGTIDRVNDAYGAARKLGSLPYVQPGRIAVIGWSFGGNTVLKAVSVAHPRPLGAIRFTAAIAFYPFCKRGTLPVDSPLLVLTGELDDWTPSSTCVRHLADPPPQPEVRLKVYPGAYHAFDTPRLNTVYFGHKLKSDYAAAEDARERVKAFLGKYLKTL